MNCPACQKSMIVLELDEIEIDYCPDCRGVWLDGGELELLLEEASLKKQFLGTFSPVLKTAEAVRKCPYCGKKMGKITCGPTNSICLDHCGNDQGLWFDAGELQRVLELAQLDDHNKIVPLLKDMLGKS